MDSQPYSPGHSDIQQGTTAHNFTEFNELYEEEMTVRPTVAMWVETLLDDIQGYLHLYIPPILLCLGLFGNIIALIVLNRKNLMQSSTTFYMAALVTSNIAALVVGCAADWIARISGSTPVYILSDSSCRIWYFILGLVQYYPTWVVTAMCIDHVICVWQARSSTNKCTTFRAKVISIFIFLGLLCVSIHAMWSYALYTKVRVSCEHGALNHYFHIIVWPWIQAALCSYVPLLLLLVFSILLLIGTIRNGHISRVLPDMNKTVLLISVTYFLFATPAAVVNLVEYLMPMSYKQLNNVRATVYLSRAVSQITLLSNYCLTFFCLVLTSKTFRRELVATFRGFCKRLTGLQAVPTVELNGEGVKLDIEERDVISTQL